jgi:hypothetical protein
MGGLVRGRHHQCRHTRPDKQTDSEARANVQPPALTLSGLATASPARTKPASSATVKPFARNAPPVQAVRATGKHGERVVVTVTVHLIHEVFFRNRAFCGSYGDSALNSRGILQE